MYLSIAPASQVFGADYRASHSGPTGRKWLSDTPSLQIDHPKLRIQASRITQLKGTTRDKAVACFQYVRSLAFKYVPDPTAVSALQVMRSGCGDCHTKATLFVALLRSVGIPARIRYVTLGASLVHGLFKADFNGVEHAFAEVLIDGEWLGVDAYVIDLKLGLAARSRLMREGKRLGYGLHFNGQVTWDGEGSAFGQFYSHDPESVPIMDWGVFDDPSQFYASEGHRQTPGWPGVASWGIGTLLINRRISALRKSLDAPAGI